MPIVIVVCLSNVTCTRARTTCSRTHTHARTCTCCIQNLTYSDNTDDNSSTVETHGSTADILHLESFLINNAPDTMNFKTCVSRLLSRSNQPVGCFRWSSEGDAVVWPGSVYVTSATTWRRHRACLQGICPVLQAGGDDVDASTPGRSLVIWYDRRLLLNLQQHVYYVDYRVVMCPQH